MSEEFQGFNVSSITDIKALDERVKQLFVTLNRMDVIIYKDPQIIHKKVYVKIDDNTVYLMNFSALYMNLVMWLFNISFEVPITNEYIYDFSSISKTSYMGIMNSAISKFIELGYDLDKYNIVGTIKVRMMKITRFYAQIVANTFSLYDVFALEARNKKFASIFNIDIDQTKLSVPEIEHILAVATDMMYDVIIDDKHSNLYPALSTDLVNKGQISQLLICVGGRYDSEKVILPNVIEQGWIKGCKTLADFYVEAVSTRNSVVVKKEAVPEAGYLSRRTNMNNIKTRTDSDVYDCGTKHYLNYFVKNEDYLSIIDGKYMVINDSGSLVRAVSAKDDKHLIGKTIKLRSHTKCITGHTIDTVCSICLGNKNAVLANSRVGLLVCIIIINALTQLGLSAKHFTSTKTEEVGGKLFDEYFTIESSNMYLKKEILEEDNIKLLIPLNIAADILASKVDNNTLESNNSMDDSNGSEVYSEDGVDFSRNIDTLLVVDKGVLKGMDTSDRNYFVSLSNNLIDLISKNDGDIVRFEDVVSRIEYIESNNEDVDWLTELQNGEFLSIDLSHVDIADSISDIKLLTEEVSRHLKNAINILDGRKTSTYTTPEEMIDDMINIIFKAGLSKNGTMIHVETMIMNQMRSTVSDIQRPDYSGDVEPEVKIIKLSNAIHGSDLFTSVAFEDVKRQLESYNTLFKKATGMYDVFFKNSTFYDNSERFKETRPYLFEDVV